MTISPHFQRQREAAKELDRIRFEARMRTPMWPRNEPALLLSLERYDHSARLMLDGLCQHYLEAVTTGRLDKWANAAHAMIDLVAYMPEAKLVKRSELNER